MAQKLLPLELRNLVKQILPALLSGLISLTAFVIVGHTPISRALGMAVTIAIMTIFLKQFGAGLAIAGALALAFSQAFWSQTGGLEIATSAFTGLILLGVMFIIAVRVWLGGTPSRQLVIGIIFIAILFWALVGAPRSLRVTTILSSGLLLQLVDILMSAHPRPENPTSPQPTTQNLTVLLLLLTTGILNNPLFILLFPAVVVGLILSAIELPRWWWAVLIIVVIIGIRGVIIQYLDTGWWLYPADQAEALKIRVPYVMADGWKHASRWLYMIDLLRNQFTEVGLALGVLGLARLSRWYPEVGSVTLVAFASYALFGLVYFGTDSTILLLPMLMILILWMTYAVYALSHWLQKSVSASSTIKWVTTAGFMLLPVVLFLRIAGLDSVG